MVNRTYAMDGLHVKFRYTHQMLLEYFCNWQLVWAACCINMLISTCVRHSLVLFRLVPVLIWSWANRERSSSMMDSSRMPLFPVVMWPRSKQQGRWQLLKFCKWFVPKVKCLHEVVHVCKGVVVSIVFNTIGTQHSLSAWARGDWS